MPTSKKRGAKSSGRGRPAGGRPPARSRPRQPDQPPVVGKRPSKPGFLALVALMWLAAAVVALLGLHTSWRLIPVVVFAGVGLLYLRGAAGSYARRDVPPDRK